MDNWRENMHSWESWGLMYEWYNEQGGYALYSGNGGTVQEEDENLGQMLIRAKENNLFGPNARLQFACDQFHTPLATFDEEGNLTWVRFQHFGSPGHTKRPADMPDYILKGC